MFPAARSGDLAAAKKLLRASPYVINATTALESTPPDRKAPKGTSAIMRKRTDSRSRSCSSLIASSIEIGLSVVNRTSQYGSGFGADAILLIVTQCAEVAARALRDHQ